MRADRPVIPNSVLLDEAAHWAARLMSGAASDADFAAWQAWCESSPAHARAGREVLLLLELTGPATCTVFQRMTWGPVRHVGAGAGASSDEEWGLPPRPVWQGAHISFAY